MKLLRILLLAAGLLLFWQFLVVVTEVPRYILPGPLPVLQAAVAHRAELAGHLQTTLFEILAGLAIGTVLGMFSAVIMSVSPLLKRWLMPVLVVSQALPVFALAPILVLWLGYGMASKIAMAVLIIFFPVTSSLFYGMQRTNSDLLELGRIMRAGKMSMLRHIILPSALPTFGSGMRVATAVAPIGAVVGEWVGSSSGLGFYMLHANARMQIDILFAALLLLAVVSLSLFFLIDALLTQTIYWELPKEQINDPNF